MLLPLDILLLQILNIDFDFNYESRKSFRKFKGCKNAIKCKAYNFFASPLKHRMENQDLSFLRSEIIPGCKRQIINTINRGSENHINQNTLTLGHKDTHDDRRTEFCLWTILQICTCVYLSVYGCMCVNVRVCVLMFVNSLP